MSKLSLMGVLLLTGGAVAGDVAPQSTLDAKRPMSPVGAASDAAGFTLRLTADLSHVEARETLLEKVWGYEYMGETNVVDVYIRYLRKKVDDGFEKKLIQTVRGAGYVLKETL